MVFVFQTDVARMLRVRDEDYAAGICRALSLPLCDALNNDSNGSSGSSRPPSGQSAGQSESAAAPSGRTGRSVVFKSVPALWKSEEAALLVGGGSRKGMGGCGIPREDDWVGLTLALAATFPDGENGAVEEGGGKAATATCDACAGFGCTWCDDGVVKVVEEEGADEAEEGLWETALCPPTAGS